MWVSSCKQAAVLQASSCDVRKQAAVLQLSSCPASRWEKCAVVLQSLLCVAEQATDRGNSKVCSVAQATVRGNSQGLVLQVRMVETSC
jgi:hypothetical protein